MKAITPRRLALMFIVVFVFPLLPILISGDWTWWEAWLYALISAAGFIASRVLAAQRHPDILRALPELRPIPFLFEPQGSKIIYVEENGEECG